MAVVAAMLQLAAAAPAGLTLSVYNHTSISGEALTTAVVPGLDGISLPAAGVAPWAAEAVGTLAYATSGALAQPCFANGDGRAASTPDKGCYGENGARLLPVLLGCCPCRCSC